MAVATQYHVLLFGDQTDNVTGTISDLYAASNQSGTLAKFLRDASELCQTQFDNLQPCFWNETPPFDSLLSMAENHAETDGSPILASCVLSYFARLGELILRTEHDPTIFSVPRVLIGLCINLFPAALAATARNNTELARLSLEGFPSYFTWVVANHARTKQIEWPHGIWSCMVSTQADVDVLQTLLDRFHEEHAIIQHKRTWIGVIGWGWVTVSGPPSTLQLLMAKSASPDEPEYGLSFVPLPVASAAHAPNIPAFGFDSTAKPSYIWGLPLQKGACIMSTDKCVPYAGETLGDITRQIIPAVLSAPLMVSKMFKATAEYLKQSCATAAVSVLGPSAQATSLIRDLRDRGIEVEVVPCPDSRPDVEMKSRPVVAIVGMSARFPQADNLGEFWKLLLERKTTHERIPHDRFDLDGFYDPSGIGKNTMMNMDGCFLSDPGAFDARLFNMSPREAMQVDPTHRLLLMTSLEALEKAGYNHKTERLSRRKRAAVYFGQNADSWREIAVEQGIDVFTAPGVLRAFSPGRVNYHFGFEGGSYSVDSACSSSATGIQLACAGLINRECDMALAGGAQLTCNPLEFSALGKSGFLAPSGGCKAFRADADGYCRGEAVGVLVLKRLEDALMDNDKIEALITGWGRNYSASAPSITHPDPRYQEKLIRRVIRQANIKPRDIDYIECHGTGTIIGDRAEMTSIKRVFGTALGGKPPTYIGSLKANVGHSESAAGVSSVIKAVLMLKNSVIPPQALITPETELQSVFNDLHASSIDINLSPVTFRSNKGKILVNSFDAAGGNTCLVIEKALESVPVLSGPDPRCWHSVTVSAQTSSSLRGNKITLLEYLIKRPHTKVSDVAYSTTARRAHYSWRSNYTVESTGQLIKQLAGDISLPNRSDTSPSMKPKVVFLFNGQGPSYYRIARELYDTNPLFQGHLNGFQYMCKNLCKGMRRNIIDILTVLESSTHNYYIDDNFTVEEHLAIVCIQLALAELWKSWGIEPDVVLGHSIGEYAALSVAGVLSVADTIWLVSERARLFEATYKRGEFGMMSVWATQDDIRTILQQSGLYSSCEIACFNAHNSHVLAGPAAHLRKIKGYAAPKEITTQFLSIPYANHSIHINRIYEKIEATASKVSFLKPQVPVSSSVTGGIVIQEGVFNAQYIARHACQPVLFSNALKSIREFLPEDQPNLWIQVGPGSTCLNFARQTLGISASQLLPSFHEYNSNWRTLTDSVGKAYVAGFPIDWSEFHRPFTQSLKLLDLPTYAFDLKTFWRPYTAATASASGIVIGGRWHDGHEFIPTASIQKIKEQKVGEERIDVKFISSMRDHRLRDAIKGHRVDGICVCPASVYIDMAYTAAGYVHGIVCSEKAKGLGSLKCLQFNSPFILDEDSQSQAIEIEVIAEKKDQWMANVSFYSKTGDGYGDDHGSCQVFIDKAEIKLEYKWDLAIEQAARARTTLISDGSSNEGQEQIDRLRRRFLYKLYNYVAEYDARYQGIVEATIRDVTGDDMFHEAVAEVKPTATSAEERNAFTLNPYHSDSLVHIGAFVLNIKLSDNDKESIYIASGIGNITLFDELSEDKTYQSYFRTPVMSGDTSEGNVYIFSGDQIVGVVKGIAFQKVKRNALKASLLKTQTIGGPSATAAVAVPCPATNGESITVVFMGALVTETGVAEEDIQDNTELSELGVDSLMMIAIIRRVNAQTGQSLNVTIFSGLRTIRDLRARLNLLHGTGQDVKQKIANTQGFHRGNEHLLSPPAETQNLLETRLKSNAVLLHGDTNSPNRPLFFVAGSTGSASIYAQLPQLASSTPIWVLESPFLPGQFSAGQTPQDIAPVYVAAIKAIQPTGPYLLGGYSAGAVYAYEIARALLDNKEEVDRLVLVDMKAHCPGQTWDEGPRMEDVEKLRAIRQGGNTPTKARSKLVAEQREDKLLFANLQRIYAWKPVPMDPGARPNNGTVMIWARWGMCQHNPEHPFEYSSHINPMAAENGDYRAWFCASRGTYHANGWDTLVGDVQTHIVDGDHWSILQMPCAAELSRLIDKVIRSK